MSTTATKEKEPKAEKKSPEQKREEEVATWTTYDALPPSEDAEVPLTQIHANPNNPRFVESMDPKSMWASIVATFGLIQRIVVKRLTEGYGTIQGGTRLEGILYGYEHDRAKFDVIFTNGIPVRVYDSLTEKQETNLLMDHNTKSLKRPEVLRALPALLRNNETMDQMSARFGKKQGFVQPLLRILELQKTHPEIHAAWEKYAMGWNEDNDPKITNEVIQGLIKVQKAEGNAACTTAFDAMVAGKANITATPKAESWTVVEKYYKDLPEGPVKETIKTVFKIKGCLSGDAIVGMAEKVNKAMSVAVKTKK